MTKFYQAHPKIIEITLAFFNLHQYAKYQFTPSANSIDTISESCD